MALIKCSECGKEISNKATNCIHCGSPIEEIIMNNSKNTNKKSRIILLVVFIIGIILILGLKNIKTYVPDENYTVKAYGTLIDYQPSRKNRVFLEGSSNNTNVSVEEYFDDYGSSITAGMECEARKKEISKLYGATASSSTKTWKNTANQSMYSYTLEYKYNVKKIITDVIADLENQGYECIIYTDDMVAEKNKEIIGKWVSKRNENTYLLFNEDGTGTYYDAKFSNSKYNFYYSYDGNDIIKYSKYEWVFYSSYRSCEETSENTSYCLKLRYDKENNLLYDGLCLSPETHEILLDENRNEAFYKSN